MSNSNNGRTKVVASVAEAVRDIATGSSLAVGGFGLCGVPSALIDAVRDQGADRLTVVSNNCGLDDAGLGVLLTAGRISRVIASYIGENADFARQFLDGLIEVELTPQGTLAERLRAGGAGIAAFYTPTGVGTDVASGGLPLRHGPGRRVDQYSRPKEVRDFDGRAYVLERGIVCDFALVRAAVADPIGNLRFHAAARNFNPLCAMAGNTTIVEAERIVGLGELAPDDVHLPGVFVQRVVGVPEGTMKPIERLTLRDSLTRGGH